MTVSPSAAAPIMATDAPADARKPAAAYPLSRRIADAITMFVVMWLSMLLLLFVAFSEGKRTFERFQGDKLVGQVQIVQTAMEGFLRSGLPLEQFVGFRTLAQPLLTSDEALSSLAVYDLTGRSVFTAGNRATLESLPAAHEPGPEVIDDQPAHRLEIVGTQYRVVVPLADKFETVGHLALTMPTDAVTQRTEALFEVLLKGSVIPAAAFALLILVFGHRMDTARLPWPHISFALIFLVAAGAVVTTLVGLYAEGAQSKSRALAESLGQRLHDLVAYNIQLSEIDGLDHMFASYVRDNADLSAAVLIVDGEVSIHTDPAAIGWPWEANPGHYTFVVDLTGQDAARSIQVAVEMPGDVVTSRILRSIKNFGALFLACAFMANMFFQVGGSVRRGQGVAASQEALDQTQAPGFGAPWLLDYVKPVFFLGVLAEHLSYSFLPDFVARAAEAAGMAESWASAPFLAFYGMFALMLIPAGHLAQRWGPKPLMVIGLSLAGGGLLLMSTAADFWTLVGARVLSGTGQGLLFIGVQSYLLAVSGRANKTRAAAIIVFGFQGGMIAGMAIGSLIVGAAGPQSVFLMGAGIGGVAALYALLMVPVVGGQALARASGEAAKGIVSGLKTAICCGRFLTTMLSIGIPAKAVLTGIISFALPLLLARAAYPQEDIGQMIMVYAIAVVASSALVAPLVDKIGDARIVLFKGATISAIGLGLITCGGLFADELTVRYGDAASTLMMLTGILITGLAHGLINAPVVTYIADSELANRIGPSTATATYRFMERLGHVAGPLIASHLFLLVQDDWMAIGIVAGASLLLGLLFLAGSPPSGHRRDQGSATPAPAPAIRPVAPAVTVHATPGNDATVLRPA